MPKIKSTVSTGIYKRVTYQFKDLHEAFKWLSKGDDFDIHAQLDKLQGWALRAIKHEGGYPGLKKFKGPHGGAFEWYPLPKNASPLARRAKELIWKVRSTRDSLKKMESKHPEVKDALRELTFSAYTLGRIAEMANVTRFERNVITGAKTNRRTRAAREQRTENLESRNAHIRELAKGLRGGLSVNTKAKRIQYLLSSKTDQEDPTKLSIRQISRIIQAPK